MRRLLPLMLLTLPLLATGCAISHYDARNGTAHLWGFGHLKMRVVPATDDTKLQAVVIGARTIGAHLDMSQGAAAAGRWLFALAGWLITALAASLGALFWYDRHPRERPRPRGEGDSVQNAEGDGDRSLRANRRRKTVIRPLAAVALLLTGATLSGCACGRVGTLTARRTLTPTAEVLEVTGWGVLLRPTKSDGGLSVGYRRATYIYPRIAGDARPVGQTFHWGWVPTRMELPYFLGTRTVGLEMQAIAGFAMLHAGYVDQSLSFMAAPGDSRHGLFSYLAPHPERTVLMLRSIPDAPLSTNL